MKNNVFVLWWQGENNAPDIVKICINSIRRNINPETQNLILITEENLNKYLDIPKYVLEKFKNGIISRTHFAELVRFMLLYKYGGLWIDATIFVTSKISDDLFNYDFHTYNNKNSKKSDITSKWECYLMSGKKHNLLCKKLVEFWLEYWKKENLLIAYLLTEHVFYICYNENEKFKMYFDNSSDFYYSANYLQKLMNKKYNKDKFNEIVINEKFIKMTYKKKYKVSRNNQLTYYGYLRKEYL